MDQVSSSSVRNSRGLRIRLALLAVAALVVAVGIAAVTQAATARNVVRAQTREDAARTARLIAQASVVAREAPEVLDEAIGTQMVAQARLAAQLVAVGRQAGLTDEQLSAVFGRVAATSDAKEFWITDGTGVATVHNVPVEFTFSPDAAAQPQAHIFYDLLARRPTDAPVIQEARRREIDDQRWKYTGVPGVDEARIVQVGVPADAIDRLRSAVDTQRFTRTLTENADSVQSVVVFDAAGARVAAARAPGSGALPSAQLVDEMRRSNTKTRAAGANLIAVVPVRSAGATVGSVALTVSLREANATARRVIVQGIVIGVIALIIGLGLAVAVGTRLVRPVEVLTTAAGDLAAGRFDPAALDSVVGRNDELGTLARSFRTMASEVIEREQRLRAQVEQLTVQIDHQQVQRDVSAIVDSDYFQHIQKRAAELRQRNRRAPAGDP